MKTIIHIIGARPNFIKAAPLIREIDSQLGTWNVDNFVLHTGQHYDKNMSDIFFKELDIPKPDFNLNAGGGSHAQQTARIMVGCEEIFIKKKPDLIIVYGDINSCVAASLVASKMHIPIAHIESGLRSYDRKMPEEINRVITDSISDMLFLTSSDALLNLKTEGVDENKCHLVGNTMIDSLVRLNKIFDRSKILESLNLEKKSYALITLHRPSNVDSKMDLEKMMDALVMISFQMECVLPIHPRTKNNLDKFNLYSKYSNNKRFNIIDPLGYIDFMNLQKNANIVITDSGGIQEESSFFGVPCLTVRDNTERPITITHGSNKLIGTNYADIVTHISSLKMVDEPGNIELWDGNASKRIVKIIREKLNV